MFGLISEKLNFPKESIGKFQKAYDLIMQNEDAAKAFKITCGSMLQPDDNVFSENAPIVSNLTGIHPYTVNMVLQLSCLEPLLKIYLE